MFLVPRLADPCSTHRASVLATRLARSIETALLIPSVHPGESSDSGTAVNSRHPCSISLSTIRASVTESEIVATTFGDRVIGSPLSRMAAMMLAAISKAPFCFWVSMPNDGRRMKGESQLARQL